MLNAVGLYEVVHVQLVELPESAVGHCVTVLPSVIVASKPLTADPVFAPAVQFMVTVVSVVVTLVIVGVPGTTSRVTAIPVAAIELPNTVVSITDHAYTTFEFKPVNAHELPETHVQVALDPSLPTAVTVNPVIATALLLPTELPGAPLVQLTVKPVALAEVTAVA